MAPYAEITIDSSNEGTVIAESLIVNNGELHPLAYGGTLPTPTVSAVPLPAGLVLLLTGLGALVGFRRRT